MKNKAHKKEPKVAASQDYDVNHPEKLTDPEYNSTTTHRNPNEIPAIENLNYKNGLKEPLKKAENGSGQTSSPTNDEPLHGKKSKTDLGNGQTNEDKKEKEKIIRT